MKKNVIYIEDTKIGAKSWFGLSSNSNSSCDWVWQVTDSKYVFKNEKSMVFFIREATEDDIREIKTILSDIGYTLNKDNTIEYSPTIDWMINKLKKSSELTIEDREYIIKQLKEIKRG